MTCKPLITATEVQAPCLHTTFFSRIRDHKILWSGLASDAGSQDTYLSCHLL